ncbi:MAG: isoprenylcysteine carboxylmethyltransferase family protein [Bacteroidales bacterium]|nr:isoprenylcysteine carboxylmethyltransferase family protein [Bacteroidales bacterium]
MALLHSFEKQGNFLFKHRGIVPVFVFAICSPILFLTNPIEHYTFLDNCWKIIIILFAILISISGLAVRAYTIGTTPHGTSGRNTDKQLAKELNTKGIYSIVRHPLYLGNYLIWLGLLVFLMDIPFLLIVSLIYWLYYERIMFAEERFLEREFGDTYLNWSQKVPAFVPKFSQFQKGTIPFHMKSVLRREYAGIFAITLCFTIVDYLRAFYICTPHTFGDYVRISGIICIVMFIIMITLRTLKHHSHILESEPNRD